MTARLIIAPANSGKTHHSLQLLQSALTSAPLAEAWAVLPNRTQAGAFRRRLAQQGGALGVHVNTFGDLYAEILAQAGEPIPVAAGALVQRLVRASVDALAARGALQHYAPIQRKPGFAVALADLIGELKRFRVDPAEFAQAVRGHGPRLEELAPIYSTYQQLLIDLGWADEDGLGWLALQALQTHPALVAGWKLVLADGFDSFNPTQLETLRVLNQRVEALVVTLSGEPGMARTAHRRFARTLEKLQAVLQPGLEPLPFRPGPVPALAHLEAALFDAAPTQLSADGRVTFLAAQTQALEAREALRWLKARLVRDGLAAGECAIIGLELAPYQPLLREAAREFGLPLYFADGERLDRNPAVAALLNVLGLALQGWARRPLLDALRCPYFDLRPFGLRPPAADELNETAHAAQVMGGLDQWQDALLRLADAQPAGSEAAEPPEDGERVPALPTGERASQLWQGLETFAARLTPPPRARLAAFVAWVEALLDGTGLAVRDRAALHAGSAGRDVAALDAFSELLEALVIGAQVMSGPADLSWAEFYNELRGAVAGARYQAEEVGRGLAAIYAGNLAGARGVSYRAVALLGLSEGIFPRPLSEEPFLSDTERAELHAAGLALEPRLRSDQQTLFYEAVTRASEYLLLTRPYLADDGERWEPSPYWNAALSLFDIQPLIVRADSRLPQAEAASPLELLVTAARAGGLPPIGVSLLPAWQQVQRSVAVLRARQTQPAAGPFEGQAHALAAVLRERYGPDHTWSASRLETYGQCRFRFFVDNALQLELRQTPAAGFDVAQLGGMLHTILEQVYQHAADPADVAALVQSLPAVAGAVFAAAPRRFGFRPTALWEAQQAEWLELLQASLLALAEAAEGFRPAYFEVRFGFGVQPALVIETQAGQIRFHGVIDRVDVAPDGSLRLIDYKTGGSGLTARDVGEGRRLQLPLYALAAEQVLGPGQAVDGYYWGIRQGAPSPLRLSKFSFPKDAPQHHGLRGAVDVALRHVNTYVQGIQSGEFAPAPPPDGCPAFCSARLFCWRYQPSSR